MALTEAQETQLYDFVKANILDVATYDPNTCVTKYLRLELANNDEAFQYVF